MRKDLILALLAGLLAGILLFPTLANLKVHLPYQNYFLFLILPLGAAFFIFIARKLVSRIPALYQFAKFVVTGGLNFTVDFGVLNILILATSMVTGVYYSIFKSISFIVANVNSYFWNKHWTFDNTQRAGGANEYVKFLVVSLVGLLINVVVASAMVLIGPHLIGPRFGLTATLWANVGAAGGAVVGLLWNYFAYKIIVFKS